MRQITPSLCYLNCRDYFFSGLLSGPLFLYVQSDENTLPKVNKVSKTEAQPFDVFK